MESWNTLFISWTLNSVYLRICVWNKEIKDTPEVAWLSMGMVVSSVVSSGPAVLEDLDARYVIFRERKTKGKERQKSRPTDQKQNKQISQWKRERRQFLDEILLHTRKKWNDIKLSSNQHRLAELP